MKWFEGSINEAVATSKSKKAIFVVFIEGKDDKSADVAATINTTEVSSRLEQENFVAIRIEYKSETYISFAKIYTMVPAPSLFFIGENGTPLDVIIGSITAAELLSKIDLVLTKAGKNANSSKSLIDGEKNATVDRNVNDSDNATKSNTEASIMEASKNKMKWFEGSINEAVATSKSKKAIFVVFIEGKDDKSADFAATINTTEVSSRLEQEDFVAIRIEYRSETYIFFAKIYTMVPAPSLFFIGVNGTPLDVIIGSITAAELLSKIDLVLTKAGKNANSSKSLIDGEKNAIVDRSVNDSDNATKSNTEAFVMEASKNVSDDVTTNSMKVESSTSSKPIETPNTSSETEDAGTKELTPEEKVERAKQLIELQQKERILEEQQKVIQREKERRKMGHDVQKFKRYQQELKTKQALEEKMKEKADEAVAREKVRQQIAQDKLERKQRELALQQEKQTEPVQESSKSYVSVANKATITRIQFRLPTGNPHMGQFEPTSTLLDLRTYVVQNIDLPFSQFAMSVSFPRRDLTQEEDDKTLLELELVPTAVILILPMKNSKVSATITTTQDAGFLSRFVWTFFAPILGVYNYLLGYFSGGTQVNTQRQQNNSAENRDTTNRSDGAHIPNLQDIANSSGLVRRYLGNEGGTTIKTEGNIHKLHSSGDDNDENNTWNGNSTQQM
ncbi:UBX domain-containing protein 4 [Colletes gigas]|uniref:UBX domain-containing protein 4 n=1 Tax=Colletes gigas TaxID=935657 RepID=UPI001C9A647D|nr:UBX domain-containing protein 4 [Colletes gigas]